MRKVPLDVRVCLPAMVTTLVPTTHEQQEVSTRRDPVTIAVVTNGAIQLPIFCLLVIRLFVTGVVEAGVCLRTSI